MKNKLILLIGIIVIVCLGIGGKIVMDSKKIQEEMIAVVKSDGAKQVFENGLKNLDQKALTPEGVIQSYEIDYDSIEHNPMGGINGIIIVNNNKNLYIYFNLDKDNDEYNKAIISGYSYELDKKLGG
ncbi:DUF1310 family protein [Carnobacterium gallinarum]|uniref:DUF1310 family protein n=1 Tax=Carnobacterium gallinarum TaxID=2749 RepID=UPI00054D824F|nr:DUF1310 family protein [Carnobacterium gallinarum]